MQEGISLKIRKKEKNYRPPTPLLGTHFLTVKKVPEL